METEEMINRVRVIATGIVQGVGYRWHLKLAAGELALTGTIRNLRDGSVEIWAEGAEEDLSRLIGVAWRGPALARVKGLDIDWSAGPRQWRDFDVVR